jgi:hypothetical protein
VKKAMLCCHDFKTYYSPESDCIDPFHSYRICSDCVNFALREKINDADKVLKAELDLRDEFKLTANGFNEWKRGWWAARSQMTAAGVRKRKLQGDQFE